MGQGKYIRKYPHTRPVAFICGTAISHSSETISSLDVESSQSTTASYTPPAGTESEVCRRSVALMALKGGLATLYGVGTVSRKVEIVLSYPTTPVVAALDGDLLASWRSRMNRHVNTTMVLFSSASVLASMEPGLQKSDIRAGPSNHEEQNLHKRNLL